MQTFLIIGANTLRVDEKIHEITSIFGLFPIEFPVETVSQVRNLISSVKLKAGKPTAYILKDIQKSSTESHVALLKTLEEPNENIFFILSSSTIYKVPQTIISRAQVIYAGSDYSETFKEEEELAEKLLNSKASERLKIAAEIKGKDAAIDFIEKVILGSHKLLIKSESKQKVAMMLENAGKAKLALDANGYYLLHLTDFVISGFSP